MPPRTLLRGLPIAFVSAAAILLGAGRHVEAAAITLGGPWLLVDDTAGNDIGKTPGTTIKIGDDTVVPNGYGGTTGVATTTNLATGAAVSRSLVFVGSTAIPNQFERVIPYNSNLLGPWTLSFTNGIDSASVTTGSLVGAVAPPFAQNVTVSGSPLNPTFSWSYPAGSVNGIFFDLFDKSRHEAAGGPDIVYSHTIPGNTGTFTVPTTLAGGLTLTTGTPYAVDLYGVVARNPSLPLSNPNSLAWSESIFDFTPVTTGVPVNLPTVTAGSYVYHMSVVAGTEYFVDPTVATGYVFKTAAGDPNFATVELPTGIGDGLYDLYSVDALGHLHLLDHDLAGGVIFDFGPLGLSEFEVSGIPVSADLDPGDTTAFVTGLTFVASGDFDGTQTPITADVSAPEPPGFIALVFGLLGLAGASRRRRPATPR